MDPDKSWQSTGKWMTSHKGPTASCYEPPNVKGHGLPLLMPVSLFHGILKPLGSTHELQ